MIKQDIKNCLQENYLPYAVSVIADRALPSIDGFKPSHRKLLYTMYKMGLIKGSRTKSANIVGQTMKLNPHGDSSIYETMVRLTKGNEALLAPLVDSKGNFGKVYSRDMAYAASRYTEAKLMPITKELFDGIEKGVVNMVDNYDGKMKEPTLLPTSFPNILSNVNEGIAVGMASKICSFNLSELCDYTIDILSCNNPKVLTPDFPTGGELISDDTVLQSINDNGRGSFRVRAKYTYDKENSCIDVYEIPYTTTCEAIVDKIEELVKTGKVKEITDIRDETDLSGLKITIDIKKNVDADTLMQKLFKLTSLEDSFGCNFNILIDNRPKVLGVESIINEWIKFRKQCLKRELEYDIDKLESECNKLMGLEMILLDLDHAISIIRNSKSENDAMSGLINHFKLNQPQVEYICTIKLINMNKDWLKSKVDKLGSTTDELHTLRNNLNSDEHYTNTIISQLQEVKAKYGMPRKTTIIHQDTIQEVAKVDLIEEYNCVLTMTEQGYIKKCLRTSDSHKVKDGDMVLQQIPSTNKSKILLFTDKGNCYYLNCHELESTQPSNLGTYLPTLLQLQDEKIIHMVSTVDFAGYLLFAFENGKVAKITLSSYETKTNRSKIVNAYNTDSPLVSIHYIEKDIDFIAKSSIDKVLVCNSSLINPKASKNSQGVKVLKSKKDSTMIEFKPVDDNLLDDVEYYRGSTNSIGKYLK